MRRWLAARKVRRNYEKGCREYGHEPYGDNPTGQAARIARDEGWVTRYEDRDTSSRGYRVMAKIALDHKTPVRNT